MSAIDDWSQAKTAYDSALSELKTLVSNASKQLAPFHANWSALHPKGQPYVTGGPTQLGITPEFDPHAWPDGQQLNAALAKTYSAFCSYRQAWQKLSPQEKSNINSPHPPVP